jgi:hypothetical protein
MATTKKKEREQRFLRIADVSDLLIEVCEFVKASLR